MNKIKKSKTLAHVKELYGDVIKENESGVVEGFGHRSFDYGLTGGAGIAYPAKFFKIFGKTRYHLGMRPLIDELKIYNRDISLHLVVLVPIEM